jgi:hypothetical protein
MSHTRRFALLLTLLLLTMELLTMPLYKYDPASLPSGGIVLDDRGLGYGLFIPSGWYGLVPPAKNHEINQMFFDESNWHQQSDIKFPLNVYQLKKYENVRLFFTRLDFNQYNDFSPTGYVIIARDKNLTTWQNVNAALNWAKWEWEANDQQAFFQSKAKAGVLIERAEGFAQTRDKKEVCINIAYFKREVGLVVIPIVFPVEQCSTARPYMDEIVNSIDLFEPEDNSY